MAQQNLDMVAELARLQAENQALKASAAKRSQITLKVSEKGCLSIYGMGRFPLSIYKSQVDRLFSDEMVAKVRQFVKDHEGEFSVKNVKE